MEIPERYYPKHIEEWLHETAIEDKTAYLYILYDLPMIDERGEYSTRAYTSAWTI